MKRTSTSTTLWIVGMCAIAWITSGSAYALNDGIYISTPGQSVANHVTATDVEGTAIGITGNLQWENDLTGGSGSIPAAESWQITGIALDVGDNLIRVWGTDTRGNFYSDQVTITRRATGLTYYVSSDGSGSNTYPYTTEATAAHVIQDAVDEASDGDTVRVGDGSYNTGGASGGSRVVAERAITLTSVNGAEHTSIVGADNIRCVYLMHGGIVNGFTITDGDVNSPRDGGGIYLGDGGEVSNCVITACVAGDSGGGVYMKSGGTIRNCTIAGNDARYGGGVYMPGGGIIQQCRVIDNEAGQYAGGIYLWDGGDIDSCLIADNSAGGGSDGGGVYCGPGTMVRNCTITGNSASGSGGGVQFEGGGVGGPHARNTIIYFNTAPTGANWRSNGGTPTYANCCTTPSVGADCVTDPPLFVDRAGGDYHVYQTSPCWEAGDNTHAATPEDLDGQARIQGSSVDIGAYEYFVGEYAGASPVHYVSTDSPTPLYPYTTWDTASRAIQDAVEAAVDTDTVLVADGAYDTGGLVPSGTDYVNRVVIDKDITVESVHGAAHTSIVGASDAGGNGPAAARCVRISEGLLSGFTITDGHTQTEGDWGAYQRGGGVFLYFGGTVSKCVISDCSASITGGGVDFHYGGVVVDCTIENNTVPNSSYGGGGVSLHTGGLLDRCVVRNNTVSGNGTERGGGLYFYTGGTARNCLIEGNDAAQRGGGAYVRLYGSPNTALLENCTLTGNSSGEGGGVNMPDGTARNCIIYGNTATTSGPEYILSGAGLLDYCCTTPDLGGTNIPGPPQFVGGADYHLLAGSPAIDAGTGSGTPDLEGRPRPLDGDANGSAIIDMGCYEHLKRSADSDGDTMLDGWEDDYGLDPTNPADASGNLDGDPSDNAGEHDADTDPLDPLDWFRIVSVDKPPHFTVHFESSADRFYTLERSPNLQDGTWTPVPGIAPRMGSGGTDSMQDPNEPDAGPFYRLKVELP